MFEPAETTDDILNMKDYYTAILLSLIESNIMDENYIKSLEQSSRFEYIKILGEVSKIIKSCDELDHEKLLSNGTCTIEEISILNNRINALDGLSSKVSNVGKFLKAGKTVNDSINLCINYYNVYNTSKNIINVLTKMKEHSSNIFLSMAIVDILRASESAFDSVISGFLAGSINATKDYGIYTIDVAWQTLLKSTPITTGALLVYRDRIAVRYYFTGDVTGCTFTANGNTYSPVAKDGIYYVEIADILPQDLDQQITLTVTDADGSVLTVTYGPMNYIVRMNQKGSEPLQNLLKALYNYHLAAKALTA